MPMRKALLLSRESRSYFSLSILLLVADTGLSHRKGKIPVLEKNKDNDFGHPFFFFFFFRILKTGTSNSLSGRLRIYHDTLICG